MIVWNYDCTKKDNKCFKYFKTDVLKALTNCGFSRIYIANFVIFKIATFWSYLLHLREKIAKFQFHETSWFFGW